MYTDKETESRNRHCVSGKETVFPDKDTLFKYRDIVNWDCVHSSVVCPVHSAVNPEFIWSQVPGS